MTSKKLTIFPAPMSIIDILLNQFPLSLTDLVEYLFCLCWILLPLIFLRKLIISVFHLFSQIIQRCAVVSA
jgi:hypothetical protein